jgi:carboxyl-terminal processing protease
MTGSDPAAAFALSQQAPEESRRKFSDELFEDWAGKDTAAAMQWANQLPDAAERDAAVEAIRSVAPVGIGAALGMQDGYPVVMELFPGTPAQLSGQIGPGDRIVALAQGNSSFVDAHDVPLADIVNMVRGAPGTLLKLQVMPANAPPNSAPRTVFIVRDQIKFKK